MWDERAGRRARGRDRVNDGRDTPLKPTGYAGRVGRMMVTIFGGPAAASTGES
jgi:hypothetical protein